MLVTLEQILQKAEEGKYAVPHFNMLNIETARGVIESAEENRSPVILGIAEVHLPLVPFECVSDLMLRLARNASVPVCIHLDHCKSFDNIYKAMQCGFTSVMYDGSSLPYEENLKNTAEVVKVAHALGISVEAELGHVGTVGVADDESTEDMYTKPSEANDFLERSGADALAVAIGTAHGKYTKTPVLDISRCGEIYASVNKPLVLHGGSGVSESDFKKVIKNGIRKVNIFTDVAYAFYGSFARSHEENLTVEAAVENAKLSVKEVAERLMILFESAGKAN